MRRMSVGVSEARLTKMALKSASPPRPSRPRRPFPSAPCRHSKTPAPAGGARSRPGGPGAATSGPPAAAAPPHGHTGPARPLDLRRRPPPPRWRRAARRANHQRHRPARRLEGPAPLGGWREQQGGSRQPDGGAGLLVGVRQIRAGERRVDVELESEEAAQPRPQAGAGDGQRAQTAGAFEDAPRDVERQPAAAGGRHRRRDRDRCRRRRRRQGRDGRDPQPQANAQELDGAQGQDRLQPGGLVDLQLLTKRHPAGAVVADPDVGAVAVGDHGAAGTGRQRAAHQGLDVDVGGDGGPRDLEPQRAQLRVDAAGQRIIAGDGEQHHARPVRDRSRGGHAAGIGIGRGAGAFRPEDGDECDGGGGERPGAPADHGVTVRRAKAACGPSGNARR